MFQLSNGTTAAVVNSPVGYIADKSGNAHHLTQATAASRPILRAGGYLEFDGINDWLFTTFATLAQPHDRVSGLREILQQNGYLITGGADYTPGLRREDLTGIKLYAGVGFACLNNDLAENVTGVITERFNGASSSLQVNSGTAVTGSPGTDAGGGFSVGALWNGTLFTNLRWYGSIFRGAMSAAELLAAKTYIAGKSGVTL